jgi:hypothetical protein
MKNIHVLPTDKPSRLRLDDGELVSGNSKLCQNTINYKYQNIYITSNEEIKEGDWFLPKGHINPHKLKGFNKINGDLESYNGLCYDISKCKKIILSTDQDLIADGVQAIDDEFLEWFVKNPSCEWIEVIKIDVEQPKPLYPNGNHKGERVWIEQYKIIIPQLCKIGCDKLILNGINSICCGDKDYKIIIPKEEPKQETLKAAMYILQNSTYGAMGKVCDEEPKQERMYSEEEVKEIIKLSCEEGMLIQRTINDKVKIPYTRIKDFTIKMFEQFKKK